VDLRRDAVDDILRDVEDLHLALFVSVESSGRVITLLNANERGDRSSALARALCRCWSDKS